jgi:hypothetical protein
MPSLAKRLRGCKNWFGYRFLPRLQLYTQKLCLLDVFAMHFQILGGSSETRTRDQRIKSPLLYRLSYRPPKSLRL